MDRHLTVVAVLNIVYRSFVVLGAMILYVLAAFFGDLISMLIELEAIRPHEIPMQMLNFVPLMLVLIATLMLIVSAAGIIGAVGVLKRREWARIVLLAVSFLNLLRVPLGTILGIYTIYVLLNAETIKLFNPAPPPGSAAV
jgi:heme/copper-type cytochrome/quinol oxidase subunit 3